ncbi:MAG TPA: MarR family transcriptional regulator [Stellaceae bacterium]|nr:MarR family transcriptional regulator [Stellaceae bacterium]
MLERFVPFRLSVLANRMTRGVAQVYMRRFHLSAPEWRTLAVLGRFGAMNANSVVERTAMDKVRVSRAVTRLLQLGHITRRTDPADRRRAILDLTPQGLAVYRQIVPRALAVEADMLSTLTAEERVQFDEAITKIESRVAAIQASAED